MIDLHMMAIGWAVGGILGDCIINTIEGKYLMAFFDGVFSILSIHYILSL